MLEPIKHVLDFQRIILASVSPRRSELLRNIGVRFEIVPSLYDESLEKKDFANPADYAVETAYKKVLDVSDRLQNDLNAPDVIIGADTIVVMDKKIYGKPDSPKTAQKYLEELSGRHHTVHTGVVIKTPEATMKFYETTEVYMAHLSEEVIRAYIRTREPLDKAGAYGIQGFGSSIIEKINGDYFNVMGLPIHSLCKHLLWLYDDRTKRVELAKSLGPEAASALLSKPLSYRVKHETDERLPKQTYRVESSNLSSSNK